MVEILLKLLGGGAQDAQNIASVEFALRGDLRPVLLGVLCALVAAAVWWLYRTSPVRLSANQKYTLTALRVLFMATLLLLVARPVLALTIEGQIRRALLVLIDTSSSMQIKDVRVDPQDQRRAEIAQGGANHQVARIDLVKAALSNPEIDLLPRLQRGFDVQPFTFGRGILSVSGTNATTDGIASNITAVGNWVHTLTATNAATALGDAMRELVKRKRGQAIAGVVVITDGANNSGIPPREAAETLKAEGIPAYVYGVGVHSPRDLVLQNVFAPEVSFADDDVDVSVRLRSQGLKGQDAKVNLKLGSDPVASRSVTLGDGEEIVPLTFRPREAGTYDLEAMVEPRADEALTENNSRKQRLRVIDSRIKVLLVDQAPRWEFRYLQAMLLRDRRIELKCLLAEADPAMARGADSPYLPHFPKTKEELFKYDVVILGDVDPRGLSMNQLDMLAKLVADFGGGLVMVAGRRASPHAYRQTILERLLPVELEALSLPPLETAGARSTRLEMTAAGRSSPLLRLLDKEDENAQFWKELPPVFWIARTARAKPAAEVLLTDADAARETRHGKIPVVALQSYGLGQVMYIGTDNTWRWRKNIGDRYYTTFWGQIIQRLALQRLLGGSKRTQLATDRSNYTVGDRIPIYARLYTVGFEPVEAATVNGSYAKNPEAGVTVVLRAVPEQPGLFRGEFVAPAAGHYQFRVEQDPATTLDFSVAEPQFELGESAMNEPLLRDIANQTGGLFFREEDLHKMPESIRQRTQPVQSSLELELWSSPLCFMILLGLVSAEWVLRKRWYLK
jgi:uncharacterized membrane protein